ncbi:Uncharacterised protein [Enterobacter asburiae]|uniref:DNA-directed DNA polymerase n=1 Tax=Enterobacter asburiae TaxID=61645 RepID=A0A376FDF8_ENTAS|nr:Uncharacterised protein [Enterobacter asburiae]
MVNYWVFPKLTIPAPYSITNMREYLLGDRAGFEAYALRDAEIAVRYALQVRNFCARELMIDRVPATIGAMAVSRFTKTLKENNMSPEVCLGTHIKTRELWLTEKQAFRTIKNPASVPSRELFETFPINCYHGGRNECFMMGVTPSDHWYDYDLAGAYTTGLLDILTPDYGNIRLSKKSGRLLWACNGICACHISVPGISSLSQPAGSDRSIWVILSIKWRIMGNGT